MSTKRLGQKTPSDQAQNSCQNFNAVKKNENEIKKQNKKEMFTTIKKMDKKNNKKNDYNNKKWIIKSKQKCLLELKNVNWGINIIYLSCYYKYRHSQIIII